MNVALCVACFVWHNSQAFGTRRLLSMESIMICQPYSWPPAALPPEIRPRYVIALKTVTAKKRPNEEMT